MVPWRSRPACHGPATSWSLDLLADAAAAEAGERIVRSRRPWLLGLGLVALRLLAAILFRLRLAWPKCRRPRQMNPSSQISGVPILPEPFTAGIVANCAQRLAEALALRDRLDRD